MAVAVANWILLNTGVSSAVTAGAIASTVVSTATSIAISAAVSAINKPKFDPRNLAVGIKGNSRVSDGPKQFVSGRRLLGGNIVYEGTTGSANGHYHIVIEIAGHEVEALGDVYFDDKIANVNDHGVAQQAVYEVDINGSYVADDNYKLFIDNQTTPQATYFVTFLDTPDTIAAALKADYDTNGSASVTMSVVGSVITITHFSVGIDLDISVDGTTTGFSGTVTQTQESRRPLYRINKHLGGPGAVADPDLLAEIPEWKSSMVGNDQAYLYIRLEYALGAWRNIPIIRVDTLGKKLYDPRTGQTVYSNNAALVLRDYLTAWYGHGVEEEDIDDQSFIVAANICDEDVPISETQTEKRYTCNAAGLMDSQTADIVTFIAESAGGVVSKTNGYYQFDPAYKKQAVISLNADNLRGGNVDVDKGGGLENIINGIKGTFVSPEDFYAATDYPQPDTVAYIAEDNGFDREIEQNYPYTTSHTTVQRLANMALIRARANKTVKLPLNMIGHYLKIGSVVSAYFPLGKINNEKYTVIDWRPVIGGVDVILRIEDDTAYDWTFDQAKPFNSEFLPYLGSAFNFGDEVNNTVIP